MRARLLLIPALLLCSLACDEDDPPGRGNAGGSGPSADGYETVGCTTLKDGVTACTTTHAPLTQRQIDDVSGSCTDDGGTVLRTETCARPAGDGCCISGAAGARVTTCYSGPNIDPALSQSSCLSSGGYWSTAIGDNPPATGAGGATGAAGSSGTGSKFKGACYQAAQHQCTAYTVTNPQLESSCTQGDGVTSATCPSDGLLGCCLQGGYVAVCYYPGAQLGDKTVEQFCAEGNNTFSATAP